MQEVETLPVKADMPQELAETMVIPLTGGMVNRFALVKSDFLVWSIMIHLDKDDSSHACTYPGVPLPSSRSLQVISFFHYDSPPS